MPILGSRKTVNDDELRARLERQIEFEPMSGCHIWVGPRTPGGYGHLKVHRREELAHRLAYRLSRGPLPPSTVLRHRCDLPPCVNPEHLHPGTPRENTADMWRRGRAVVLRGEAAPGSRLTAVDVARIRQLWDERQHSQAEIARRFGIARNHVSRLVRGVEWTTVPLGQRGRKHFTADEVRAIRIEAASGTSQRALARRSHVSETTISKLVRRLTWESV